MSGNVEFQNKQNFSRQKQSAQAKSDSKMANAIIRTGIIKNKQSASLLLLIVAIAIFSLSVWIFYNNSQPQKDVEIIYREDIPSEILDQIPLDQLKEIPSRN